MLWFLMPIYFLSRDDSCFWRNIVFWLYILYVEKRKGWKVIILFSFDYIIFFYSVSYLYNKLILQVFTKNNGCSKRFYDRELTLPTWRTTTNPFFVRREMVNAIGLLSPKIHMLIWFQLDSKWVIEIAYLSFKLNSWSLRAKSRVKMRN